MNELVKKVYLLMKDDRNKCGSEKQTQLIPVALK